MDSDVLPEVWGILNLTPDSFYAGSRVDAFSAVAQCRQMLSEGADVIDIGAESTRPGSASVSAEEEWERLKPALEQISLQCPEVLNRKISVDTRHAATARKAFDFGISIINDVSAGSDAAMFDAVAGAGARIVLMHSKGTPADMQISPSYSDVVAEVYSFLLKRTENAVEKGIKKDNIIWDYGIGFGKTDQHNRDLLASSHFFASQGFQLMAGVSRKSFLGRVLNQPQPEERKFSTHAMHMYLALQGVQILRVHDVKEAVEIRSLLAYLRSGSAGES